MPDCVQFQELILAARLVFIAGIAEAKSKGRGEECISQNLRVFRGHNGKLVMLFFANSQRKELKRYVSIPGMLTALNLIHATILTASSKLHRDGQSRQESRSARGARATAKL
jgi:hypothetical protein